jgi:DNA recombination protein RmuC
MIIALSLLSFLAFMLAGFCFMKLSNALTKSAALELDLKTVRLENQILQKDNGRLSEQSKFINHAEERLKDTFKSLAASTLESSTKHFLELAQSKFENHSELQKMDIDKRQQAIDDLLKPVSTALEKYQEQIGGLERERQKAFTSIDQELKRVADLSSTLGRETAGLKDALKRPHVRGRWGEVQLRNCIELAGMSEYADVSFQNAQTDEEGTHIPDMVVRMPGGRIVVVDAKTPIDAFIASLEAPTEELRVLEMARHGRHVKEHVRKLSARSYNEIIKDSPDFTVLFLPNESFLYAALEQEPDLVEYALQRKILISTPPTLIGLLKVIRFGWNEERLADNAQKISEVGKELHKRLCDFVEGYDKVGKFLEKAKDEYDKGRNRLNSRVIVQAQRFETLGVRSSKNLGDGLMISEDPHQSEENFESKAKLEAADLDNP